MTNMEVESWLSDPVVVEWLRMINTKRTVENYQREFPLFMRFVTEKVENPKTKQPFQTPTEIIESRKEQLENKDYGIKRFWENAVIGYMHHLEDKEFRANTIATYLRTALSFFSKNHVMLSYSRNELIGGIRAKGKGKSNPISKAWIPTRDDVKIIYRFAESARDKAITLCLFQSGVSEVEVTEILIEDCGFYDASGHWKLKPDEHLYYANERSKTREIFQTCFSAECLENIKDMLAVRGYPQTGYLFVSFRGQKLTTRDINSIFKGEGERKGIVEKAFNGRVVEWQTKNLRDSFMNALEQAKIPQKIADLMVGHKPEGAKSNYKVTSETIRINYSDAFKFLSMNGAFAHAMQLDEIRKDFKETKSQLAELIADQQKQIKDLKEDNSKQINKLGDLEVHVVEITKLVNELEKKYQIDPKDIEDLKETTSKAIERINSKMTLVLDFMQAKFPELSDVRQKQAVDKEKKADA